MAGALDFDTWLCDRFRALNTDEAVFAPYIRSIVEGDESLDEKVDALDGILAELANGDGELDVEAFREEILSRWTSEQQRGATQNGAIANGSEDANLESKLESILKMDDELKDSKLPVQDQSSEKGSRVLAQAPDSALRAAILSQYRDDSDEDEGAGDRNPLAGSATKVAGGREGGGSGSGTGLERNTNAERVLNDMKDRRDREKADAAKKRERDKEDRAKQKQQAQERKDKAKKKATKVERKR